MAEMAISRLMHYLRAYDEIFEWYPESEHEGEAVGQWILECALGDGRITQDEFAASLAIIGGDEDCV